MSEPATPRELLTIRQACIRASVSRRTLYNWMNEKRVSVVYTAGGSPRIYADTLFHADGTSLRRRRSPNPRVNA